MFIQNIFVNAGAYDGKLMEKVVRLVLLLLGLEIYQYIKKDEFALFSAPVAVRSAIYIVMLYGILILGNFEKNEFIYFVF